MQQRYKKKIFGACNGIRVVKRGKLYGAGNNRFGQLGFNHTKKKYQKDQGSLVEIPIPEDAKIVMFHSRMSNYSTVVLTTKGLMGTGYGQHGMFGDGKCSDRHVMSPILFYKGKEIEKYYAEGWGLWVFLENGNIWRSGSNDSGQMGDGGRSNLRIPKKLATKGERMIELSSRDHTLLLSARKQVYATGYNRNGELGLSHYDDVLTFSKVNFLSGKDICQISCGCRHSLFLASNNSAVYSCGSNGEGELGLGDKGSQWTPTIIPFFRKLRVHVLKISTGEYHSIFLSDNHVYFCGGNSNLQCGSTAKNGLGQPTARFLVPTCLKVDFKPIDIETAACSSFVVADNGSIFAMGQNFYGECGLGHLKDRVPELTDTKFKVVVEREDSGPILGQLIFENCFFGVKKCFFDVSIRVERE